MEDTKESEVKKKDTIWKIIMPDKRREHATDSERRLVEEVEAMIEQRPQVQKTLRALQELDEKTTEDSTKDAKERYTVKKNRISAQLSRDRRSAIV